MATNQCACGKVYVLSYLDADGQRIIFGIYADQESAETALQDDLLKNIYFGDGGATKPKITLEFVLKNLE